MSCNNCTHISTVFYYQFPSKSEKKKCAMKNYALGTEEAPKVKITNFSVYKFLSLNKISIFKKYYKMSKHILVGNFMLFHMNHSLGFRN